MWFLVPRDWLWIYKIRTSFNLTEITGNKISEFTEKPNYEKACEFIKDKRYTWNSGMFLFKASVIKKELEKFYPKLVESCKNSLTKVKMIWIFKD